MPSDEASSAADDLLEFIRLPTYERTSKNLFDEEGHRRIESMLVSNPESGAIIEGTGGVRKIRVALPGGGKSGGVRVIYYYRQSKGRIYLVLMYPKNVRANITKAERNEMRKLTAALEGE